MDVEKLRAILEALQGTEVTRLTWVEGQETLDLRLGHPPPPTTSVHAMPMAAPASGGIPTPPAVTPVAPASNAPIDVTGDQLEARDRIDQQGFE